MRPWQSVVTQAAGQLRAAGVEPAAKEARRILQHHLGCSSAHLSLHLQEPADRETEARYAADVARRADRHPLSHITGRRAFFGHDFIVTPDVLDPRPETEVLVREALSAPVHTVLDLGTGSGAILLSILAHSDASGTGVDISAAALEVAQRNAEALGLSGRCRWLQSSWLENVTGDFDLIVSNPPYIAQIEMTDLSPEVLHEPAVALTDGGDGLGAYRVIAHNAGSHLRPGGRIILEIGPTQAEQVGAMLHAAGFKEIAVLSDFDGRNRVVAAQKLTNH